MTSRKVWTLPGQLELFPDWQEDCPLCRRRGELTTCRRLYSTRRACLRCAEKLTTYGWKRVREG
jgi:hypothetical protein